MPPLRARIFVDFWNLQLNIIEERGNSYRLDWTALSPFLIAQSETLLGSTLQLEETTVYLSYDPNTTKGKSLRNWAINALDRFPGIRVVDKERKVKRAPSCPNCHRQVQVCPYCGGRMRGTIEKGIDTAIVTDMIKLAWADAWDVAVLVSSDRDFIPVVEFLTTKGRRVINAYFPPKGMELARVCWANIDLKPHLDSISR
jgi:uncharacterized LabA/DUF88 family protein